MNKVKIVFTTIAAFSTIMLTYSISVIVFYGYEKYLHEIAFYSLIGFIVSFIFGSQVDRMKSPPEVKN